LLSTESRTPTTLAQTDRNEEVTVVRIVLPHHVWRRVAAGACLVAPVVALLWVPWYAQDRPELAGVPFFYWYQLAWVPISVAVTALVYVKTRGL
jgi:hypothetical protein